MDAVDKNQCALLIPKGLSSRSLIQTALRALWNPTTSLSYGEVIILSDLPSTAGARLPNIRQLALLRHSVGFLQCIRKRPRFLGFHRGSLLLSPARTRGE